MFYEDVFDHDEQYAREVRLRVLGYMMPLTGDPLVDKWNRILDEGGIPDLSEGESEKSKQRDTWVKMMAERHYHQTGERLYKAPTPLEMMQMDHGNLDLDYLQGMNQHIPQGDPVMARVMNNRDRISPAAFDAFYNAAQQFSKD